MSQNPFSSVSRSGPYDGVISLSENGEAACTLVQHNPETDTMRMSFNSCSIDAQSVADRLRHAKTDVQYYGRVMDVYAKGKDAIIITLKALFDECERGSDKPLVSADMQDALLDDFSDFLGHTSRLPALDEL